MSYLCRGSRRQRSASVHAYVHGFTPLDPSVTLETHTTATITNQSNSRATAWRCSRSRTPSPARCAATSPVRVFLHRACVRVLCIQHGSEGQTCGLCVTWVGLYSMLWRDDREEIVVSTHLQIHTCIHTIQRCSPPANCPTWRSSNASRYCMLTSMIV